MIWMAVILVAVIFAGLAAMQYEHAGSRGLTVGAGLSAAAALVVLLSGLWVAPQYKVWQQRLEGEAELARAEQNRQVITSEALAKMQSSRHLADAEIERARGAAEANRIVADSLGGPEGYLRWLFIEKLSEIPAGQVVYLPTEAGIPILEANRLGKH